MITFRTELGGQSDFVGIDASISSYYPKIGYRVPIFAPDLVPGVSVMARSRLDSISSGKAEAFNDRFCDNFQIEGTVTATSNISGADTVSWSPSYGIPSGADVIPQGLGYSFDQMLSHFGTTYSPTHVLQHRAMPPGIALRSYPDLPLLMSGVSTAVGYGATQASRPNFRYIAQEGVTAIRLIGGRDLNSFALFKVTVNWTRHYDQHGNLVLSGGGAQALLIAGGPSEPGGSDYRAWYPNCDSGIWSTRSSYPYLPSFLKSFTRNEFEAMLLAPASLLNWSPRGIDTVVTVPTWTRASINPAYYTGRVTVQSPSINQFVSDAQRQIQMYFSGLLPVLLSPSTVRDWQDLGDTAADNLLQTSVNHYANALQIRQLLGTLKSTISWMKDLRNPRSWAKQWLSLRYGDRLTFADANEDVSALVREVRNRAKPWNHDFYTSKSRSTTTVTSGCARIPPSTVQHYVKLYYRFTKLGWWGKMYTFARKWELWPTTEDAWDLIPYSFVVDWFIDVQSLFEEIDRDTLMNNYIDILSVILTEKQTWHFDDLAFDGFVLSGAEVTHYVRTLSHSLPSDPFRAERGHASTINVVDGISLIIQAH